ncbi:MAG: hypothetical protein JNM06_25860, partial [Blastocatellia bacterium]|nr:hypothetical protein [Blastocatellia bacterium]
KEHALIESAVSSNRIEGIEINESRIATVIFGQSLLQDRDEEEIRGYRDALKLIHEKSNKLPLTEKIIKEIHYLTRAKVGDAGEYKERESNMSLFSKNNPLGKRVKTSAKTVNNSKSER